MGADNDQINERLRSVHLAGVDEDERAAMDLQVERHRLILYGSLGTLATALAAIWAENRIVCVSVLHLASVAAIIAGGCAWIGLLWAGIHRWRRASRKYITYADAVHSVLKIGEPPETSVTTARQQEGLAQKLTSWLQAIAAVAAMVEFLALYYAIQPALHLGGTCPAWTFWPLSLLN